VALLSRTVFVLVTLLAAAAHAGRLEVGDRAPDVTLLDWSGGRVSLAELRGRPVCIDFWATWCIPCRTALPALDAIARRRPDVVVLAVNIDRDRAAADRFLGERLAAPAMTLLHDPGGATLARFGAAGMPALYVVDAGGTVRLIETGYGADGLPAIERAMDEALRTPD
jgi:cytochrome c biogenesis protein CcmG/thiol:disulfide interchange protein DsbE